MISPSNLKQESCWVEYSWFYFLPFYYFKYIRPFPCRISVKKSAYRLMGVHISSVQSLSHVRPFTTPWTAAHQASLSIANSQSLLKLMSTEPVMPSNHLILCCPLLLHLQSFPASGSFQMSQLFASGGQSIVASASAFVLLMNIQSWFPLGLTGLISLLSKGPSRVFSNTTF